MCVPCLVIWVMLPRVVMSGCYDMDICFDAGESEKPRFYINFLTNLKTLLIFMQRQPFPTIFLLPIWGFHQYSVLYLDSNSKTTAPGTVHPAQDRGKL